MILERIYDLALPRLEGKKIREVRIGLGLMAVELDSGQIGVTYVLRGEVGHGCGLLPQGGNFIGTPAREIAGWALQGKNVITVALGLAVLNSVAEFDKLEMKQVPQDPDAAFATEVRPGDTVGIVGHIGPLVFRLKSRARRLFIFERGEDVAGEVYPESAQPKLLPECQVDFISSTSIINRTLENLLQYCNKAREVVMVGSSTPLYPEAFSGTGVTVLSGTRWLPEYREAILAGISQCLGIRQLIKYGRKISVRVEN